VENVRPDEFTKQEKEAKAHLLGRTAGNGFPAASPNHWRSQCEPTYPGFGTGREVELVGRCKERPLSRQASIGTAHNGVACGGHSDPDRIVLWGEVMSPRAAFCALYEVVKAEPDGFAYLGDSSDGTHALYASLFTGDEFSAVVVEAYTLLPCPACGENGELGDLACAICVHDDGYAFRIDLLDGDEDEELRDDEIDLLCEAAQRARDIRQIGSEVGVAS